MHEPRNGGAELHTLLLRLAGPMQSWGFRSRFDHRDTALEPTRSGVIGLLCAALGWERDADLTSFAGLKMGVRVDAPGQVMVDFQTVKGYMTASGKVEEEKTIVTRRAYLSDARFLVGLESADLEWLCVLDAALRAPKFPLFLGRKSYVPSLPPALPQSGVREDKSLEAALRDEPWRHTPREGRMFSRSPVPVKLRLLLETSQTAGGTTSNDLPLDFAGRRFGLRTTQRMASVVVNETLCLEDELCLNSTFRV